MWLPSRNIDILLYSPDLFIVFYRTRVKWDFDVFQVIRRHRAHTSRYIQDILFIFEKSFCHRICELFVEFVSGYQHIPTGQRLNGRALSFVGSCWNVEGEIIWKLITKVFDKL